MDARSLAQFRLLAERRCKGEVFLPRTNKGHPPRERMISNLMANLVAKASGSVSKEGAALVSRCADAAVETGTQTTRQIFEQKSRERIGLYLYSLGELTDFAALLLTVDEPRYRKVCRAINDLLEAAQNVSPMDMVWEATPRLPSIPEEEE